MAGGAPSYIEIGGGSFGFQIGVQASDVVLVFTDEDGIKSLLEGKAEAERRRVGLLLG